MMIRGSSIGCVKCQWYLLLLVLLSSATRITHSFAIIHQRSIRHVAFSPSTSLGQTVKPRGLSGTSVDDNESQSTLSPSTKSGEEESFASYLAPYALATLASLVATGLFFQYVLLGGGN